MATKLELERLDRLWSMVITNIYPDIGVVVKGEPGSIKGLLSVWDTGNPAYDKPTEAQLLAALAEVEADIAAGEQAQADSAAQLQADLDALDNADDATLRAILRRRIAAELTQTKRNGA